jgi:hypothetical protein
MVTHGGRGWWRPHGRGREDRTAAAVGVEEAVEEADSVEEVVAALAEDLKDAVGAVVVLKPAERWRWSTRTFSGTVTDRY